MPTVTEPLKNLELIEKNDSKTLLARPSRRWLNALLYLFSMIAVASVGAAALVSAFKGTSANHLFLLIQFLAGAVFLGGAIQLSIKLLWEIDGEERMTFIRPRNTIYLERRAFWWRKVDVFSFDDINAISYSLVKVPNLLAGRHAKKEIDVGAIVVAFKSGESRSLFHEISRDQATEFLGRLNFNG